MWELAASTVITDQDRTLSDASNDQDPDATLAHYHRQRVQHVFGFCMEDFREECWWFEPVDMMRKLCLSGLLQFIDRATAAQCFAYRLYNRQSTLQ